MVRTAMSASIQKVSTRRWRVCGCWLAGQLSRSHISGSVAGGRPSLQVSSRSWPRTVASRRVAVMMDLRSSVALIMRPHNSTARDRGKTKWIARAESSTRRDLRERCRPAKTDVILEGRGAIFMGPDASRGLAGAPDHQGCWAEGGSYVAADP